MLISLVALCLARALSSLSVLLRHDRATLQVRERLRHATAVCAAVETGYYKEQHDDRQVVNGEVSVRRCGFLHRLLLLLSQKRAAFMQSKTVNLHRWQGGYAQLTAVGCPSVSSVALSEIEEGSAQREEVMR